MKAAYLQEQKESSLRQEIYQTIKNTKFQSVSNLLKKTRKREHSLNPISSRNSNLKPSVDSLHVQTQLSGPRLSFSPPCNSSSKASAHRSTDYLHSKYPVPSRKNHKGNIVSRGSKQQSYHLGYAQERIPPKRYKSHSKRRHKTTKSSKEKNDPKSKSRSNQSGSRDKGSSRLNLSSILQQQSSQQKLVTPSSKAGKSRYRQGRKFSGDRTKKKGRHGLKDIVWRRLQRSLRQPQKFHRLLKNDILNLRFRILRKSLLQIEIQAGKDLEKLNITLDKGNLECQGIQQYFPRLDKNDVFSLYSSVRSIDLTQPLHLPRLLIEASLNQDERYEKFVTLPYCWIHQADYSHLKSLSRSRIKTKTYLEDMSCSKLSIKGLLGVLPGWNCQSIGRASCLWESKMVVCDHEFEFRIVENNGHYTGELSGRGEQRLTRMLQFLEELLS